MPWMTGQPLERLNFFAAAESEWIAGYPLYDTEKHLTPQ
jgi:hypothetical protein